MGFDFDYKSSSLKRLDIENEEINVERSGHKPQSGDVIAVRIKEINSNYKELDLAGGNLVELEEGEIILGTFGNRAGVKGYIGEVPDSIEEGVNLSFLGSGGIFGEYKSSAKDLDDPCTAEFLGYVSHNENILNTRNYGIESSDTIDDVKILAVVASRMDAGKTTLATKLIERLSKEYRIGSLKLTGSARERDRLNMYDAGSKISLDFVDAGLPTTVEDSDDVITSSKGLINYAWREEDLDFILVEFGAGLISNYRVKDVLKDLDIKESIFGICAVSLDVAGAYGLKEILDEIGYEISFISGPITDTTVGKRTVEDNVGVHALNAFNDEDLGSGVEMIKSLEQSS